MRTKYLTLNPQDDRKTAHFHTGAALLAANMLGQDPLVYNRDSLHYFLGQEYRFVSGHFAFSNHAFDRFKDKYAFVTLLRNPVEKWISLYFFNRYKEGDHYALEQSLEEFLESEMAIGYGCDYAMQFAGDDSITNFTTAGAIPSFTTQEAVDRAIRNLEKFHLVGVLENLPVFVREFQGRFGVPLEVSRMRQSPVSDEYKDQMITPEIHARVEELNRPNMAIYDHVVEKLVGNQAET